MLENTARVIHIGLNYVIAPKKPLTRDEKLEFQRQLGMVGLEAENTVKKEGGIGIKALYEGIPVIVETFMNSPATGQLLILMPENPNSSLFPKVAEAVGDIYLKVFTNPKPQVFPLRDGCIRKLYSLSPDYPHAFQYIWEKMLGKSKDDLSVLGKPILGGGLRFVMPPNEGEHITTEVRIESSLQDSKLIFVEGGMKWQQPEKIGTSFQASELFTRLNDFIDRNVVRLIMQ